MVSLVDIAVRADCQGGRGAGVFVRSAVSFVRSAESFALWTDVALAASYFHPSVLPSSATSVEFSRAQTREETRDGVHIRPHPCRLPGIEAVEERETAKIGFNEPSPATRLTPIVLSPVAVGLLDLCRRHRPTWRHSNSSGFVLSPDAWHSQGLSLNDDGRSA